MTVASWYPSVVGHSHSALISIDGENILRSPVDMANAQCTLHRERAKPTNEKRTQPKQVHTVRTTHTNASNIIFTFLLFSLLKTIVVPLPHAFTF